GKLTLQSPGAADEYVVLDNQTLIQWAGYNTTDMKIYYSLNGGGSWTYIKTIPDPVGSTTTYWDVNMPQECTNEARIKINATANEAINDTSSDFYLIESFDVTYPENGTVLVANQTYSINWTRVSALALANVTIYFDNGTGNYTQLFGGNVTNNGTHLWQVPTDVIATNCKIRVQSPIYANNSNQSFPDFTIRGDLDLSYPDGGNQLDAGSTYPVNWSYIGPIENVTIQYSANGTGGPWSNLTDSTAASPGTWNWTIDPNITLSTSARIKVFDKDQPLSEDISLSNFTVKGALRVTYPNASDIFLYTGSSYNITWNKYGSINTVNISYSNSSNDGPWKPVAYNVNASNQSFEWTVPDDIGNALRVNVTDTQNPTVWNMSSYNFSVVGNLVLNKPNTGEPDWVVDTVVQINWTPQGNWSTVKIEGSTNGFIDENETFTINASLPAGTGGQLQTYNWTVEDYISDTFRVRVSDTDGVRANYTVNTSDGNFSIVGNLTVVTPNTNVTWYAGDNPILQWYANGTVGNVDIRLWDGLSWHVVVNNTTTGGSGIGAGSYSGWTIPLDIKSENCRINVTDETDSTVFDSSDVDFSIRPFINVTSPVNEQNVYVLSNNSELIQWTITGTTVDFVDIWYDTEGGTGGYPYQIASRVAAAQGNYTWNNVPQRASNDVRVKVVDNTTGIPANTTVYGESASFNILGKLTLQSPGAADEYVVLDNQTLIQWAGYNTTDMKIYYSLNGGGSWTY
ncbi:MAG: hypothetical protein MJA29_07835, partial [Candidatus Omnitrophica bacterium]|nr:hypothetical protein [Candidatus Omnitrophota bacterium]